MRRAAVLTLLTLLVSGAASAGACASAPQDGAAGGTAGLVGDHDPAALPDTPSASMADAQNEVHLPSSFRPTWAVDRPRLGQKLSYGLGSLLSVRNLAEALLLSGVPNLPSAPTQPNAPAIVTIDSANAYETQMDQYGDEMDVWRRSSEDTMRFHAHRLEAGFATAETRQFLSNLALPIALHQEARYRPARIDASLDQRLANAAASIVITHDDHGRVVPNYSRLVGTVAAGLIGKDFYAKTFNAPELDSNHFLVKYVGYSLAADLATNVAHELLRASTEPDTEVYDLHGRSTEDSYYPLSAGGKFVYWARSTYAARNFIQACLTAGLPVVRDQPVEPPPGVIVTGEQALFYDQQYVTYGNDIQAWRRNLESGIRYHEHRLIGGFAAAETQMTLQNLAVPMLLGIDPRYIPLGAGYDMGTRLGHTFKSLFTARTDAGGHTVNLPVLLGTAGGALAAKELYYPRLGTPALETNTVLATTIGLNLAADLLGNIRSEFFRHRGY